MMEFSYEDIEAATDGFALGRLIGKGSHGCVYKGTLRGGKHVAVKKPLGSLQKNHEAESKLDNEIDILGSTRAPHLVNLLGVSRGPASDEPKLLVMEFMPNGTLHDLLHASSSPPPSWPRRMFMALQIACAVQSLHEAAPRVIHRDIKTANILLDGRRNAKLADFSLAVREGKAAAMPAGTFGYLDPRYTVPEKLSPKSDVFSFGVVLLELVSARPAMDVTSEPASIISWAVPMIRAGRAADVCDARVAMTRCMEKSVSQVLSVAARCVSLREERRPMAAEVVAELQGAVELVWWPIWSSPLRSKVCMRSVYNRCIRDWRRCGKSKVIATKIECKDHLDDGDHLDDDDDTW